jgi:hypothetical protein
MAHHGASRSGPFFGLSYQFAVRCDDARLGEQVDALFGGLRDPAAATAAGAGDTSEVAHWYALTATPGGDGTFDVARDDERLALDQPPGDALGWVVWDINRSAAAAASDDHLLFHAGALDADGAGVLLPGASGSGKSTLTAGLARAGLGYLSDELTALDLRRGRLLPYAKPITLKHGSFGVVADLHPDRSTGAGGRPWSGAEWQVAVGASTGLHVGAACAPALVVVPRYEPDAPTRRRADAPHAAVRHRGVPFAGAARGEPVAARHGRQRGGGRHGDGFLVLCPHRLGPGRGVRAGSRARGGAPRAGAGAGTARSEQWRLTRRTASPSRYDGREHRRWRSTTTWPSTTTSGSC